LEEDGTKIDGDEFIFKFVAGCLAGAPVLRESGAIENVA